MDFAARNLAHAPLLESLLHRRSRRFGAGMSIPSGPFAFSSQLPPQPLGEAEEAALVFAGAGITGSALADMSYGASEGGTMIAGLVGRTIASADAIQSTALVVTNDDATYLVRRPADLAAPALSEAIRSAASGELVDHYRQLRRKIRAGRAEPPLTPPINFTVNHWSLYAKGGSYFLPVNDVTRFYINGVMEMFDEGMDLFLVDERRGFRPAGLARFGKSRGGRLHDDPRDMRMGTVAQTETVIAEMLAIELGAMLQSIQLMAQAIGLGAWPSFARHEFGWFDALGFRMAEMPATRFLGAGRLTSLFAGLSGREVAARYPVGLEVDGEVLLRPYTPPHYPSMRAAVRAIADEKFGDSGVFRGGASRSAWRDPAGVTAGIAAPKEEVIDATAAYCQYLWDTYGRFPVYLAPFRTILGAQVTHVDPEFYDRFFGPGALSETQRTHEDRWHGHP